MIEGGATVLCSLSALASGLLCLAAGEPAPSTVAGGRFLTLTCVVRLNQIEATRERWIGADESALHTPEAARAFREAISTAWPEARITWAFSWGALHSEADNYRAIRELIAAYHRDLGDDITYFPGGYFAPMYDSREQVNRDVHEALARIAEFTGEGFRPKAVIAGFFAAENLRYLAEEEGIHVCQGNIWSQHSVDFGDGEGSISYPYYPSREHFLKPAQGAEDRIDCVNLDGWTCDFVSARHEGVTADWNSRLGVGPIECLMQGSMSPDQGLLEMLATTATHLDDGYARNGFGWVTDIWELSLVPTYGRLEYLQAWLREIRRRWPDARCVPAGEFGLAWRADHPGNDGLDYRFVQRGTGFHGSEANLEIRWFMAKSFRLALMRDWIRDEPERVLDFTRYDLPAREPDSGGRNWSLMNRINQKGTRPQDQPVPLAELPPDDRALIASVYPELVR